MKTRDRLLALLWVCLLVLATQAVWGQPNYRFKVYGTDGVYTDSVTIGLWSTATYGMDTIVVGPGDTIKEVELPPTPLAGNFNFRSADLLGRQRQTGQGLGIDVRHSSGNPLQMDTIRLQFQSSDAVGAQAVTFSWSSNLYTLGYQGFKLEDGSGLPVPLFSPVDMTLQTQFTHPIKNAAANQYVNLIIGPGFRYRTFAADSIGGAVDSKGKRNAEKNAGTGSDWTLTFTNTNTVGLGSGGGILISFSQNVLQFTSSVTIDPPTGKASLKTWHLMTGAIPVNGVFTVSGVGGSGKAMTAKAQFTSSGTYTSGSGKLTGLLPAKVVAAMPYDRVTLKQPNINNILTELYAQGHFPINVGSTAGFKYITYAKLGDVQTAMGIQNKDKTFTYSSGPSRCFTGTDGGYKWTPAPTKAQKPAKLTKYDNRLVVEQLALKINLLASAAGKIPAGLNLLQVNSADPVFSLFNGQNLDQVVAKVDAYLSNCDSSGKAGAYTGTDLKNLLHAINNEFSGKFDTAGGGFSTPYGVKTPDKKNGATHLQGVKSALTSTLLKQVTVGVEPVIYGKNYNPDLMLPEKFTVMQNYPNPFNPTTTIEFNLPEDALVTVKVYNILGQEVTTLADRQEFSAGSNRLEFNAASLASGVYFYRVIVNDGRFQEVKKMMLMK